MKLLTLLCLVQLLSCTGAAFNFSIQVISYSTIGLCLLDIVTPCDVFFSAFCLRESRNDQSTSTTDCPLGSNKIPFHDESGTITISSTAAWQGGFQLFIKAMEQDTLTADDDLDSIFIEQSITSSSGLSPQVTVSGSSDRVSITVRFQLFCQADFYGVDCFTFCREADNDVNGHYTCNPSNGSPVCRQGYHNPANFCRENFDDCSSGPCQSNGTCTDLLADFECSCPPGYTGKDCSLDIDECVAASCLGNSTCVDGLNSFTCRCNPGYEADNCTDFDDCSSGPCQSNGTCTDLLADFECSCPPGYTGKDCSLDIDECEAASCLGNSTCVDGLNSFTCRCNPGYEADNCTDFDDCSSGPCQSNGTCTDLLADFECSCPPGYTGKDCSLDIDECAAASCLGNSTCVDGLNSFTCRCNPGYEADNCTEVDPCVSSPCHNGGTCVSSDPFSYSCLCIAGYSGSACEDDADECLKGVCPPGLICHDEIGSFRCVAQIPSNAQRRTKIVLIGSVVGAVFFLALLGLVAVLLIVRSKRHKDGRHAGTEESIYLSCPAYKREVSLTPLCSNSEDSKDGMTSNQVYGKVFPSNGIDAASLSDIYHSFDNNLYTETSSESRTGNESYKKNESYSCNNGTESGSEHAGHVYENPVSCKNDVSMIVNISYNIMKKTPSCEEVDNPLYGEQVSNPLPSYSALRPVLDVLGSEIRSYEKADEILSHEHNSETPSQSHGSEIPSYGEIASNENSSEIPLYENGREIPSHENGSETRLHRHSGKISSCSHSNAISSYENSSTTPSHGQRSETQSHRHVSEITSYENSREMQPNEHGGETLYYSVPMPLQGSDTSGVTTAQLAQNLLYESISASNDEISPKKSPPELPPPRKGTSSCDNNDKDWLMVSESDAGGELTHTYEHLQHELPSQPSAQQPARQEAVVHPDYEYLQT